jgi:hypothetical protein
VTEGLIGGDAEDLGELIEDVRRWDRSAKAAIQVDRDPSMVRFFACEK